MAHVGLAQTGVAALFEAGVAGGLSDEELLSRFVRGRGNVASESAFTALVARHGPMVRGACTRMLGRSHAVDDAFQATFLVLARKAHSVRVEGSLGRWLYGVSVRVARRARDAARTEARRAWSLDGRDVPDASAIVDSAERDDLRALVDEEVARLPARYRSVVVLFHFEGLSHDQTAARLRCPLGTVQSRLHRARAMLRSRLSRRGIASAVALGAALGSIPPADAVVPRAVAADTIKAATRLASGAGTREVSSAFVAHLVHATLGRMFMRVVLLSGAFAVFLGAATQTIVAMAQASDSKPASSTNNTRPSGTSRSVRNSYENLLKEYEAADQAWRTRYNSAPDPGAKVDMEARWREWPAWSFAHRFVKFAESHVADPTAVEALVWVVNRALSVGANDRELLPYYSRALQLLEDGDHFDDKNVGLLCHQGLIYACPASEKFLRTMMVKSRTREAQGRSCIALAELLEGKLSIAEQHWFDSTAKPPLPPYAVARLDSSYAEYIKAADTPSLRKETETLLERAAKEYGDIIYNTTKIGLSHGRTIGEIAERNLFELRHLSVGQRAPEIDAEGVDGKRFKLSEYRGKVVVLNFWATWCGPCMSLIEHEKSLVKRLKGKPFALLGVDGDSDREQTKRVMEQERITWPSWWDKTNGNGPIATRWNVRGWPTIYVIDAQGVIRYKQVINEQLDEAVDTLLKEMERKTEDHR